MFYVVIVLTEFLKQVWEIKKKSLLGYSINFVYTRVVFKPVVMPTKQYFHHSKMNEV